MSDVISNLLIQIKADATSALAAFKNVVTGTQQVTQAAAAAAPATTAVSQAINTVGQEAEKAGAHIRGLTYYFRSGMDSMRFALMGGGNPMAAFYAADEGIRAMLASGMKLTTLVPVIGSIAAVVGVGALAWHEWNEGEREAAKNAKDLADAWKSLPDLVKTFNDMEKVGLLSSKQAQEYVDYANGNKPLYVDENGNVTRNATRKVQKQQYVVSPSGVMVPQEGTESVIENNRPATAKERQKYSLDQATAGGTVTKEAIDALMQLRKLTQQTNEESLTGIEKEKAEIRDKYQEQRDQLQQYLDEAKAGLSAVNFANSADVKAARVALTQNFQNQFNDIAALTAKAAADAASKQQETLDKLKTARSEELRQIDEQQRQQQEADKQHEADLQRQAQLTRDIHRSDLEDQIEMVKSNALLTDQQKLQIVTALNAQQKQINDAEIGDLEKLKSQVKSLSDQLELEKKIAQLKHDNNRINQQTTPGQQNSFGFQFSKAFVGQQDKWTGWAQESADSFSKAWNGATSSVSGGLTHLFEYGAQKGQWFREMWNGVIGSMISSATNLAVEWVSQHIIMQGISTAFHSVENALTAQSVTAHAIGEQTKTASTAAGATERGAIRMIETVMHNVLVALRVAAHVAGEALSTAATAVGAAARAIYHAIAAAVGAMESEASVPYVGVILGIAAGAAIMAAAYGMMGGFMEGGYTGPGHPSQIAGVVHAGEYVIPASKVNSGTMGMLHAIRSGALTDAMPMAGAGALPAPTARTGSQAGGAMQINTSHYIFTDKAKMARAIEQDDAHAAWVVDTVAKSSYKIRG